MDTSSNHDNIVKAFDNAPPPIVRLPKIGDVLVHCTGAYAHRTHTFAEIMNITNTKRIRIRILQTKKVSENGDDTVVIPSNTLTQEHKLLSSDRTYGRGTVQEYWDFYNPLEVYKDHFDAFA